MEPKIRRLIKIELPKGHSAFLWGAEEDRKDNLSQGHIPGPFDV